MNYLRIRSSRAVVKLIIESELNSTIDFKLRMFLQNKCKSLEECKPS